MYKIFIIFGVAFEIGKIRDNEIDPEHIIIRKRNAAIDYDYVVLVFKNGYIFSDLVKSTERYYLQF